MRLDFTKMHGLGNDFVVINALGRPVDLDPDRIRQLADRHTGIGFDQLLLLQPPRGAAADVSYRVFNADGSEAEQCGNGARCIGRYLRDRALAPGPEITAETARGPVRIQVRPDGNVRVDMGAPSFEPRDIPLDAPGRRPSYRLELGPEAVEVAALSMGNPHAVLYVPDVESAPVETLGPRIQGHGLFPAGVNVGFLQVLDRGHVRLRVYERGAGETLACGTGACAAAVTGIRDKRLDNEVVVGLKRGKLVIGWEGEGTPVWMSGPAATVYEGHMVL